MEKYNFAEPKIRHLGKSFSAFKNFLKESEAWLTWAKTKSIFQQLKSRKIDRICILPILSTAGLRLDDVTGKYFCVYFNEYCKTEHTMGSLGHEIGHTFHYDLESMKETFNHNSRDFYYNFDSDGDPHGFFIEDLCNSFARKFVAVNTKEKIERDCKNNATLLSSFILMISNAREKEFSA